jgi:LysR family hydrogen peroxide-inducible transcriptional activator
MVASGIGVTLLPGMAVETGALNAQDVALTPFADRQVAREIGLMWRKKTPRRAEFRLLGDLIRSAHAQAHGGSQAPAGEGGSTVGRAGGAG